MPLISRDAPSYRVAETMLLNEIIRLMCDPEVNPYGGSMAVERVQNLLRNRCGDTYDQVIEKARRGRKNHTP